MMEKCRHDGYLQWWIFDGCEIKYANPTLKYLSEIHQNLCVGVCDIELGIHRPCVQPCKSMQNDERFRNKLRLKIRVL